MVDLPRAEYPRPQFQRDDWLCLNGPWDFEIDRGDSGEARGLITAPLAQTITVPFCPESTLSGIGNTDFLNAVWYRRQVRVPDAWEGQRILLHFQAVDHDATVWINDEQAAWHRGGWTPFQVDLGHVAGQTITITVRARDDHREAKARGKQCDTFANRGCLYTRTTGIWQTVWMEPVSDIAFARPRITPDVARNAFELRLPLDLATPRPRLGDLRISATLRAGGQAIARASTPVADLTPGLLLPIPSEHVRLWSPEDPFLYDIDLELIDAAGNVIDHAATYAGLRSVQLDGRRILINGKSVFQRLVLDQGYYPDGIMTAPSDEALKRDIELSMAAGFNGARLHQKLFEERFLYHADRLGYLCWGEYGDWGINDDSRLEDLVSGWAAAMQRDHSHPSIIGWCPLNEQFRFGDPISNPRAALQRGLYAMTKAIDPTRPCIDVSGGYHVVPEADVIDNHDYEQDPELLAANYVQLECDKLQHWWANPPFDPPPIAGRPFFVSEFGGTWWVPGADDAGEDRQQSWGYGNRPRTEAEFLERFKGLCHALLNHPAMFGYCYTQLTDVFQEQNGIYTFDREDKFDPATLRAIQMIKAAIED